MMMMMMIIITNARSQRENTHSLWLRYVIEIICKVTGC